MRLILSGVTVAGVSLLAMAPLAAQDTPPELRDLVGARGGQAEDALTRRGYAWVRTEEGRDRKWSMWWNANARTCVTIATVNGRYDSIRVSPPSDCRQPGRPDWRPVPPPPPPPPRPIDNRPYPDGPPSRPGGNLTLICWGEGQKPGTSFRSGYVWNPRTHRYESYNAVESTSQRFDSTIQVELWGDGGRIRLAGKLIPPIHSGGRDGWWDLDNVQMGRDRITAQYRLNGLNKPRVEIDRRIGRIAIDGIEKFRGTCDQGDWSGSRNKF